VLLFVQILVILLRCSKLLYAITDIEWLALTSAQPPTIMHFRSDEIQPFYEVRQRLSKAIDEIESSGEEIIIAKHGKPVAALLSAAGLYRYREIDRLMGELVAVLDAQAQLSDTTPLQASFVVLCEQVKAVLLTPSAGQVWAHRMPTR
jgi:prevent-host-death family protein